MSSSPTLNWFFGPDNVDESNSQWVHPTGQCQRTNSLHISLDLTMSASPTVYKFVVHCGQQPIVTLDLVMSATPTVYRFRLTWQCHQVQLSACFLRFFWSDNVCAPNSQSSLDLTMHCVHRPIYSLDVAISAGTPACRFFEPVNAAGSTSSWSFGPDNALSSTTSLNLVMSANPTVY